MPERLSDVRQIALVLRLALTKEGRLVHGEILDAHGQSCGQFREWSDILGVLQDCAADANSSTLPDPPPASPPSA